MSVTTTCRDIKELDPVAQKACNLFMTECKKAGLNVCITETYRSQARQDYLYAQGRTRSGNIVTWTKKSNHTGRMAWDICKNIRGQEYSDPKFFEQCGAIAKKLGITWGGTWKTPDRPHFEVTKSWKIPVTTNGTGTAVEKYKKQVQERFGFEDRTIEWLATYKSADALFTKLATKK